MTGEFHQDEGFPPPRDKRQALAEIDAKFRSLGLTDARRAPLSRMIVALEDEIEREAAPICPHDRRPCQIPRCAVCPIGTASGMR